MIEWLEPFHFLRPAWLLLVPAALVLWWSVRSRGKAREEPPAGIAGHLADALLVGRRGQRKLLAIDGVVLAIVLAAGATAGPTWSRVPNPLVAQTAPLAMVLCVSESMLTSDVQPSRLERAKHKLLDLSAGRAGGRTALIAYAASAHRVVPLTEDPSVLKPFLEGLEPDVMPADGRNAGAALKLAREALTDEPVSGAILFVLDELDRSDLAAFERHASEGGEPVVFLLAGGTAEGFADLSRLPGASVVRTTPDAADIESVERRVASAYRDALAQDDRLEWDDRGWVLAWPAMLLTLVWFRRGWTTQWSVLLVAGAILAGPQAARAEGIADWFFTPDQQGRLAWEDKRAADAAELFQDPMWRGTALMLIGQWTEAAQSFARVPSADAAFAQGMAFVKNREYRKGITSFQTALARDPGHVAAARNVEITEAILAYVEAAREASDVGEGSEGADELRFDKEAAGGVDTVLTGNERAKLETAEQWMRTVDTRTNDFLRIRFAIEAEETGP